MIAGILLWIALAAAVPYVITPAVQHAVQHQTDTTAAQAAAPAPNQHAGNGSVAGTP